MVQGIVRVSMNNIIDKEQIILLREHYKSMRTKNLWLWEQIYSCGNTNLRFVGTNLRLWEQIYGCGNKSMVVRTKNYGCGNKYMVVEH
jgi:hypothetical protein